MSGIFDLRDTIHKQKAICNLVIKYRAMIHSRNDPRLPMLNELADILTSTNIQRLTNKEDT